MNLFYVANFKELDFILVSLFYVAKFTEFEFISVSYFTWLILLNLIYFWNYSDFYHVLVILDALP